MGDDQPPPRILLLYGSLRDRDLAACRQWQADGRRDAAADPAAVAELLFSVTAGFTAQRVLVGDADIDAHVGALRVLGHLEPPISRQS